MEVSGATAAQVAGTAALTEVILRVTPKSFNRSRFGLFVSVISGVAISLLSAVTTGPIAIGDIINGIMIGLTAGGVYDAGKAVVMNAKKDAAT